MSSSTVCGLPAQTYTYGHGSRGLGAATPEDVPPTTFLQVVARAGGRAHLVIMLSAGSPESSTYQRDAERIVTGFEVLPPANGSI